MAGMGGNITMRAMAQGWRLDITTGGAQVQVGSDAGRIDSVQFTSTGNPGEVHIVTNASINAAHGQLGEEISVSMVVNNGTGQVTGTINCKGAGKGR